MREDSTGYRILAALLVLGWACLVHRFWFVTDDAFISFRYAVNFAEGAGLRYNVGFEVPVEGYSNLLWVLYAAALHLVGARLELVVPLGSALCSLATLWRVHRAAGAAYGMGPWQRLFTAAFVALSPAFALWSSSGMETAAFVLAIFVLFEALALDQRSGVAKALVAATAILTLRPEGPLWIAGMMLGAWAARSARRPPPPTDGARAYLLILSGCVAAVAVLTLWRLGYYGLPLPMPVYVKSALTAATLVRGMNYVAQHLLTFLPSLLLVPAALSALRCRERRSLWVLTLVMALAPVGYAIGVGGDFMPMGRYLLPGLPFTALLLAKLGEGVFARAGGQAAVAAAVAVLALNLAPAWDLHVVPETVRAAFHFRHNSRVYRSELQQWVFMRHNVERWKRLGLALRDVSGPGDTLVAAAIGSLGFYSGLDIYDCYGLVTPEVADAPSVVGARSPGHDRYAPPEFFLRHRPTYLSAAYFSGPLGKVAADQRKRAWDALYGLRGYRAQIVERAEPEPGWAVLVRKKGHR